MSSSVSRVLCLSGIYPNCSQPSVDSPLSVFLANNFLVDRKKVLPVNIINPNACVLFGLVFFSYFVVWGRGQDNASTPGQFTIHFLR